MCQKQIKIKTLLLCVFILIKSKTVKSAAAFIIIKGHGEVGLHYIKSASKSFISFIISENKRKVFLRKCKSLIYEKCLLELEILMLCFDVYI